jgi:hypothetical protein
MPLRFSIAADDEPAIVGGGSYTGASSILTTSVGNGTTLMDRLDSLGSETEYLILEAPAEWSKPLIADVLRGKR